MLYGLNSSEVSTVCADANGSVTIGSEIINPNLDNSFVPAVDHNFHAVGGPRPTDNRAPMPPVTTAALLTKSE